MAKNRRNGIGKCPHKTSEDFLSILYKLQAHQRIKSKSSNLSVQNCRSKNGNFGLQNFHNFLMPRLESFLMPGLENFHA